MASSMLVSVVDTGTVELELTFARKPGPAMGANEIVPEDVMGPPVRPAPVATLLTLPLLLNVFQSVEFMQPAWLALAVWHEITGDAPPERRMGDVAVRPVREPSMALIWETVRSASLAVEPVLFPLMVRVGAWASLEFETTLAWIVTAAEPGPAKTASPVPAVT
jgi:hypothetical protein